MQIVSGQPHPNEQPWRLQGHRVTSWRAWDGEMVVYDDRSGDTQKLDLVTAEVFKRLQQGEATLSQLTDHLAKTLDLESNRRLAHIAETAVTRLAAQGLVAQVLVEPQAADANAPAPPPRN